MAVLECSDKPLEPREYPDEADLAEDDEATDVAPCPMCGEYIYEDAPQCPYCRQWILGTGWTDSARQRNGKWYVRAGRYLTKTLLINWIFWLAVAAGATVVAVVELLR